MGPRQKRRAEAFASGPPLFRKKAKVRLQFCDFCDMMRSFLVQEMVRVLNMHIFLVGMAGAGKTSLGRRLAANLNLPFVDTDQRVSEIMGMSVIEVFQSLGEAFFRNAETGVLMDLVGKPPCVVSTGGGLPTARENVLLMQNHGVIIHIDRPLDQILSDIKMDRRPTLVGGSHENVIDQYNERIGHYKACADYRLDNSHGFTVGLQTLTQMVESLE